MQPINQRGPHTLHHTVPPPPRVLRTAGSRETRSHQSVHKAKNTRITHLLSPRSKCSGPMVVLDRLQVSFIFEEAHLSLHSQEFQQVPLLEGLRDDSDHCWCSHIKITPTSLPRAYTLLLFIRFNFTVVLSQLRVYLADLFFTRPRKFFAANFELIC